MVGRYVCMAVLTASHISRNTWWLQLITPAASSDYRFEQWHSHYDFAQQVYRYRGGVPTSRCLKQIIEWLRFNLLRIPGINFVEVEFVSVPLKMLKLRTAVRLFHWDQPSSFRVEVQTAAKSIFQHSLFLICIRSQSLLNRQALVGD